MEHSDDDLAMLLAYAERHASTDPYHRCKQDELLVSALRELKALREQMAELVRGDGVYYISQERAFAPGSGGVLPEIIKIPGYKNARLVKRPLPSAPEGVTNGK